ncbi:MAG: hypothetical protein JRN37_07210 [Nitrososphaerota archaeon]|jgi:hypothetical protein|nr:hypothetical protein [Nitrososphaerota archaeon]MDG7041292.1 hypothetical protein [Nitrososphaerota archaeon]MDG7042052.1 hypothetical protein [Nitrososphaerota archaeon]MDG7046664.1 hypothetical protein [Nitrososphaerota archaeon]
MIRHLTSLDNSKNGEIIDPLKVKHGVITALKISDLSGWIDPTTHLNLDFPEHLMGIAYVVKKLELGGEIILEGDRFMYVIVNPKFFKHLGNVDITERSIEMRRAFHNKANISAP